MFLITDDKPKSDVKSQAKRRLDDIKNAVEERKERNGLHALNTAEKTYIENISVQIIFWMLK